MTIDLIAADDCVAPKLRPDGDYTDAQGDFDLALDIFCPAQQVVFSLLLAH